MAFGGLDTFCAGLSNLCPFVPFSHLLRKDGWSVTVRKQQQKVGRSIQNSTHYLTIKVIKS